MFLLGLYQKAGGKDEKKDGGKDDKNDGGKDDKKDGGKDDKKDGKIPKKSLLTILKVRDKYGW